MEFLRDISNNICKFNEKVIVFINNSQKMLLFTIGYVRFREIKFFRKMRLVGLNSEKNSSLNCFRLVSQANLGIRGCRDFTSLEKPVAKSFCDTANWHRLFQESISVKN